MVPGQIGLVQAAEVIKLILGIGITLKGRLLVYDALDMDFKLFNLRKNDDCPLCGKEPLIRDLSPRHYKNNSGSRGL